MPSRNQRKGYESNKKARAWLLANGYTYVWFHPHPRYADRLFIDKDVMIYTRDIFNLFDGICLDEKGFPIFFQIKTNSWASYNDIEQFIKGKNLSVLFINVKKGKVLVRKL